jgi:hypothetical protein
MPIPQRTTLSQVVVCLGTPLQKSFWLTWIGLAIEASTASALSTAVTMPMGTLNRSTLAAPLTPTCSGDTEKAPKNPDCWLQYR